MLPSASSRKLHVYHLQTWINPLSLHLMIMLELACFMECTAIDLSPNCPAWKQATLSLSHGGLGLRSVFLHCSAAYISSISASSLTTSFHHNSLRPSIFKMPRLVSPNEALSSTFDSIHTNRHVLSQNLEDKQFQSLLQSSTWLTEPDFFPSHPHMLSCVLPLHRL